jgi:hypothetical protein
MVDSQSLNDLLFHVAIRCYSYCVLCTTAGLPHRISDQRHQQFAPINSQRVSSLQWRIQDLKEGGAKSIAREARAQKC